MWYGRYRYPTEGNVRRALHHWPSLKLVTHTSAYGKIAFEVIMFRATHSGFFKADLYFFFFLGGSFFTIYVILTEFEHTILQSMVTGTGPSGSCR